MDLDPVSTKHKVMLAVCATLIMLCTAVIVIVHHGEQRSRQAQGFSQLQSITSTLSEQISPGHIRSLLERYDGRGMVIKNTQDAWYYVLHERLRKSGLKNGLGLPLEIVVYDSLKQELQVIVTSDEEPRFREPWNGDHAALMAQYGQAGHLIAGQKQDRELLAFDVVSDTDGSLVGMVVARASAQELDLGATASLLRNIGLAVVLFGIAGFLMFRYVGGWLRVEEEAREKLKVRHDDITDSIAYAGKIQRSLVPSALLYDELFPDSFVIDRPKDVVSGDFHWVYRVDAVTCYVAAADCTGHGLPGAMMAAIGCSLLNEIVPQHAAKDPAEILGILHARMVSTLNQKGKHRGAGDGMDVALCRVDRKAGEILFAGAFRPLYWLHQGQLSVINGDRRPVGGGHPEAERRFTTHRLAYLPGDRIYLFSDGYVDQFGGPERKRFMTARLHGLIMEYGHLPLKQQARLLDQAFLDWKGSAEQVDDVCLLGLAV